MGLIVQTLATELIAELRPLVARIERHDRDLGKQVRRAASSVVLNIAEGSQNAAGNRRARFETAAGSANEVRAALEVATSWGYIPTPTEPLAKLDRIVATLWRLSHHSTAHDSPMSR